MALWVNFQLPERDEQAKAVLPISFLMVRAMGAMSVKGPTRQGPTKTLFNLHGKARRQSLLPPL